MIARASLGPGTYAGPDPQRPHMCGLNTRPHDFGVRWIRDPLATSLRRPAIVGVGYRRITVAIGDTRRLCLGSSLEY